MDPAVAGETTRKKQRTRRARMANAHPEVLDAEAAAGVLGVSKWLVLRLARQGKLPGKKVGKEWRFRLTGILRWLGETEQSGGMNGLERLLKNPRVQLLPKSRG